MAIRIFKGKVKHYFHSLEPVLKALNQVFNVCMTSAPMIKCESFLF